VEIPPPPIFIRQKSQSGYRVKKFFLIKVNFQREVFEIGINSSAQMSVKGKIQIFGKISFWGNDYNGAFMS